MGIYLDGNELIIVHHFESSYVDFLNSNQYDEIDKLE